MEAQVGDLAGAILDGVDIEWEAVESNAAVGDRLTISQLKILSRIANVYDPPPGPSWGPLRIFEAIGRGAFGEVFRAWDTRLDREVALKLLPAPEDADDRSSSIIEEGRLLARVRHPNVATIYGAERIGHRIGLWMELVDGRTLEQLLAAGRQFSIAEAVNIGVQMADAIEAVHAAGLLHRDIKAQNVMLTKDGRAVLTDFGTGQESKSPSIAAAGTPLYLAPEVLCDRQQHSVQSDIYALGVLLYRLLTGAYPTSGSSLDGLRAAHATRQRPDLRAARPDLSARLARTIERALDPDPGERYTTASAFRSDLQKCRSYGLMSWTFGLATAASLLLVVWFAGRGAQDVAAREPVIVVLPFRNLSTEPESDLFVAGLIGEIISDLASIEGLQVRPRSSSSAFEGTGHTAAAIGRELDADFALEGDVLLAGTRLRINVHLVKVADDVTAEALKLEHDVNDIFAIQDEIARAVVNKLRLTLGRGQRRYDTNWEACEPYLKGQALNNKRGPKSAGQAIKLFQQSIQADAEYAPAYAGLVHAYAHQSMTYQGIRGSEALELMKPAALEALRLDPTLAEAHAAMGVLQAREHNWEASDSSFRTAISSKPSSAQIQSNYVFFTLRPLGRFEEAEIRIRTALEADPNSLDLKRELAELAFTRGRYEEAISLLREILAVDPDFTYADMYLARSLVHAGKAAEALETFDVMKARGQYPEHYVAQAYVSLGRRREAEQLARANRGKAFWETVIYLALGDLDRAFEALERTAIEEGPRLPIFLTFPESAALRADPRFPAFCAKWRLPLW